MRVLPRAKMGTYLGCGTGRNGGGAMCLPILSVCYTENGPAIAEKEMEIGSSIDNLHIFDILESKSSSHASVNLSKIRQICTIAVHC